MLVIDKAERLMRDVALQYMSARFSHNFANFQFSRYPVPSIIGALLSFLLLSLAGCQSPNAEAPDPSITLPAAPTGSSDELLSAAPEETGAQRPAPRLPRHSVPSQDMYRSLVVDGPYIAITFDDGPSRRLTPQLLDILKEREIPVTFFLVGDRVRGNAGLLQRMVAEGHEIGNHGWDHSSLATQDDAEVRRQIEWTDSVIRNAVGHTPVLFRPPYGATSPRLNQHILERHGMPVILWSVDSQDWQYRDPQRIQRTILSGVRPGAIILAHDIQAATIAAMPATLDILLAEGYRFVTVSQLIAMARGE